MNNAEMPSNVQSQIQAELQPGERIRWSGQPVVGESANRGTWLIFLFAIPWTAFAVFWTVGAASVLFTDHGAPRVIGIIFPLFGLPFIGIGIWMLTAPWRVKKKTAQMASGTAYVVTDRRAIIIDAGYATFGAAAGMMAMAPRLGMSAGGSTRIQSFAPDKLQQLARVQHADGTGDILFSETSVPVVNCEDHRTQMVPQSIGFKSITDVQQVERLLKTLAQNGNTRPPEPSDSPEPPVMER